jgi:6-pyruvoyltetrahydropterin/6-carboxytetrahydropterin synthase
MSKWVSTKEYKEIGPVAYRQYKADSHCRLIHGYALSFKFYFEGESLDVRNWICDYGSLKSLKEKLCDWFDHTLLVAEDDPEIETFKLLGEKKLAKLVFVERTGCEGLAKFLYDYVQEIWLPENGYAPRVRCLRVEVRETDANMAYYEGSK